MVSILRKLYLCLGLYLLLDAAHGATLTASIDRRALTLDEHVMLTLTLDQSDVSLRTDGVNPNIDLTLLSPSFTVGTPRIEQRYNSHQPQGRAFSEMRVELFPKKTGDAVIPSFNIDNAASQPIIVTVKPSIHTAPLAFSEFRIAKDHAYQHEQLHITLDVFSRVELESAQLGGDLATAPKPVELLDVYSLPTAEREEIRHGFSYHVLRRGWAVFPEDAGDLTLLIPDIWIVTQGQEQIHLAAGQHTIMVDALPEYLTPPTRVGHTRIELEPLESPGAGLLNWRIRVSTRAQRSTLPTHLVFPAVSGLLLHSTAALFRHETDAKGVTHIADYTLVAQALRAGQYQIPSIRIAFFDPTENLERNVSLNIPTFSLKPETTAKTAEVDTDSTVRETSTTEAQDETRFWLITTMIFAGLWIATMAWLWHWRRTHHANIVINPQMEVINLTKSSPARPLEQQLLSILQTRSLSEGLELFDKRFGSCDALNSAVAAVQQHYYGRKKFQDDALISTLVAQGMMAARSKIEKCSPDIIQSFDPRAFFQPTVRRTKEG